MIEVKARKNKVLLLMLRSFDISEDSFENFLDRNRGGLVI